MAEITAAAVKELREVTGLPMMDCKQALTATQGDKEAAVKWLREQGRAVNEKRADRDTAFGRFGLYTSPSGGAMVELRCESAPVAGSTEFIQLANDLAKQLATGPGAKTAEELLAQASPSKAGSTLGEVKDDMFNRIREVFNVGRMIRYAGATGGYSHNSGTVSGVLVEFEGGKEEHAKDVSMHIAAMKPKGLNKEDIAADLVDAERQVLKAAALAEGKPANIVDKMVEGRLRNFYAEKVLTEQPFVKDEKQTVGAFAQANGMKLKQFTHWEL
ncbi:MAG TPA: translation elongation factor Ts [Pirellulaceae bacterium]|nr:translation elongation factor Ts [Pirellulaceae bacterium]